MKWIVCEHLRTRSVEGERRCTCLEKDTRVAVGTNYGPWWSSGDFEGDDGVRGGNMMSIKELIEYHTSLTACLWHCLAGCVLLKERLTLQHSGVCWQVASSSSPDSAQTLHSAQ